MYFCWSMALYRLMAQIHKKLSKNNSWIPTFQNLTIEYSSVCLEAAVVRSENKFQTVTFLLRYMFNGEPSHILISWRKEPVLRDHCATTTPPVKERQSCTILPSQFSYGQQPGECPIKLYIEITFSCNTSHLNNRGVCMAQCKSWITVLYIFQKWKQLCNCDSGPCNTIFN